jgi:exopolyphosphatase / guanosine-5'-triphosphate,3'-diphosphate pyrophosphatase
MSQRVAAIDVGSNSIHMLVVEKREEGLFNTLETTKETTRLAADLGEDMQLGPEAFAKVSTVLKRFREIADGYGAQVRAVGTHALREAKNGPDFCQKLYKKCGVQVEIVSGKEEARLVYLGVQSGLPVHEKSALLVDIGGGSAEILLGQWGEERFATSLKLGAVRLTEKYLKKDPFREEDLVALKKYVDSRLSPIIHEIRKIGFDTAVGSSGTIKAVKSLALGLQKKPLPNDFHGVVLSVQEVSAVCEVLLTTPALKDRKSLTHMDSKRADIIVAGALVLDAISRMAGVPQWTISLSALREGIVMDTLSREGNWLKGNPTDVRWRSVRHFAKKLQIDEAHAWHITSLAVSLFDQLKAQHGLDETWRECLRSAAFLHESGLFVSHTGHHKHAYYLIRHSALIGFTEVELERIACLVRFHRKKGLKESEEGQGVFDPADRRAIERLSAILRLAVSLDRGRLGKIQEVRLNIDDKNFGLQVFLHGAWDVFLELYEASLEKEHFEKAFACALHFEVAKFAGDSK